MFVLEINMYSTNMISAPIPSQVVRRLTSQLGKPTSSIHAWQL